MGYIDVCLVNKNNGVPFISALELRLLNNIIHKTQSGSALQLWERNDYGANTTQPPIRYKDDVYDRLWFPVETPPDLVTVETKLITDTMSNNDYKPPPVVMRTAVISASNNGSLVRSWKPKDTTSGYYVYMHFFEVDSTVQVPRQFAIDLNGITWLKVENLPVNKPLTVFATAALKGGELKLTITPTNVSTFPPLLNAVEIYIEKALQQLHTQQEDVDAMMSIKNSYKIISNWQGDPCLMEDYLWNGLKCNYDQNTSIIISLNLTQRELTGEVDHSIFNLKSVESLDLSYNNLTGKIPAFLADMPSLKVLNLAGNKFTGSVPQALLSKNGSTLTLSVGENPHLCVSHCGTKKSSKKKYIVAVSIISVLVLVVLVGAFIFWKCRRIGSQGRTLKSKNRRFLYPEVVSITNNFERVIGKGGFGTVYLGHLEDGTEVAVKMLSRSSTQGSKQFWTEAELLTTIHHRNLASLIGYCDKASKPALVYEYMANGNLKEYLLDRNRAVLTWEQRLQIAVQAAHALEYLHNGCEPPIIHRDIKTTNILLDDKVQAKVSDFGLSRILPIENGDHVTTAVMGTFGYLDPEYYIMKRLTKKSDVYSFGVVLLELITGQPAIIKSEDTTHIVQWVMPMIERGEIRNIADPRLQGEFHSNSMWKALKAAMECVPSNSFQRLTMREVVRELNECLEMVMASGRDLEMSEISTTTSSNGTEFLSM